MVSRRKSRIVAGGKYSIKTFSILFFVCVCFCGHWSLFSFNSFLLIFFLLIFCVLFFGAFDYPSFSCP